MLPGAITVPHGTKAKIKGVLVTEASHPIPDDAGVEGTKKILSILRKADQNDLVIVLISGGGRHNAFACIRDLSFRQAKNHKLASSLGSINSRDKFCEKAPIGCQGRSALRHVNKSCALLSLVLSDVMGDDLGIIASGPTYPDSSTFGDALNILRKYRIENPITAIEYIAKGAKGEIAGNAQASTGVIFSHSQCACWKQRYRVQSSSQVSQKAWYVMQ